MKKAAAKAWDDIGMLAASVALADILMQAFVVPEEMQSNFAAMAAVAGAVLLALTLLFYNRRAGAVTLSAAAVGLAVFGLFLWRTRRILSFWNIDSLIPGLFYWIAGGSALAVFALSHSRWGLAALFAGGAVAGCGMWLMGYRVSAVAYAVFLAAVTVLFLRRQFELSARRFPHVDMAQRHVTAAAAGITALALLSSVLVYGVTEELIPSRFIASRDLLAGWLQDGMGHTAGYDNTRRADVLGGPVRSDDTPVMDVRTDDPFYLKGASFLTYTGRSWERGDLPLSDRVAVVLDRRVASRMWMPGFLYASDPAAFRSMPPLRAAVGLQYYRTHDTAVALQDMTVTMLASTRNLFLPVGYVDATRGDAAMFSTEDFGYSSAFVYVNMMTGQHPVEFHTDVNDFGVSDTVPRGTVYTVTAPRYDMSSPEFQTAANAGDSAFESMTEAMSDYYGSPGLETGLSRLYGSIREQFARPDAAVTERTRKLAQTITRSCRTDTEKVEAVREYFSHGYTYTLTPERTPGKRDFIDYFLFTGKEGYCVHFASAMTELLRSAGVPARYVEGYVAPPGSEDGVYHVTRNQAHAWVEVYSSLLGWYPVEATPGFGYVENSGTAISSAASSTVSSGASSETDSQIVSSASGAAASSSSAPQGGEKAGHADYRPVLFWLLAAIVLLAALFWLCRWGVARIRLRRLRKKPAGEQVTRLYAGFLRAFRRLGFAREPEETPEEWARRLAGVMPTGEWDFIRITRLFESVRYGGAQPSAEEVAYLWRFRKILPRLCRRQIGRSRYLFRRLFGLGR